MPPTLPVLPSDVAGYTRAIQDYFLRTDPRSGELVKSKADADRLGLQYAGGSGFVYPNLQNYPDQTLALLRYFDRIDAATGDRLGKSQAVYYGGIAAGVLSPLLSPFVSLGFFDDIGASRENIVNAWNRWLKRKENYREITEVWKAADPDPFAKTAAREAYASDVSGPLFLGWYPDREQQTTLDAITPLVIANMLAVSQENMRQAWDQLVRDLTLADLRDAAKPDKWPAWVPIVAGVVGVGALVGVGVLIARRSSSRSPKIVVERDWSPAEYRRTLLHGIETERREHPYLSDEQLDQLVRDHLAENPYAYPPGNPHPVCGARYGQLTEQERELMPASAFGLPRERKYPMPDSSHARNAKARAAQQLRVWKKTNGRKGLSPAAYRKVVDRADRIIEECESEGG